MPTLKQLATKISLGKSLRIVLALFFGASCAITYETAFLNIEKDSIRYHLTILLYLSFFFSVFSYWALFVFAQPRLANYSNRIRWGLLVGSILAGIFLVLVIPIRMKPLQLPTPVSHLDIIATGEKNVAAKGSEVWLINSMIGGVPVQLESFTWQQGWEQRDNALVSYQDQPASLSWEGRVKDFQLTFLTHAWSGLVKVRWNGKEETLDLYSNETGNYTANYFVEDSPSWFSEILPVLTCGFVISLFLFGIVSWFSKPPLVSLYPEKPGRNDWFFFTIPMLFTWIIYLLTFWPGLMSNDSLGQWSEVVNGRFTDAHPALHTLFMWFVSRIWLTPGLVALSQIVILSLLVAFALGYFHQLLVPTPALWIAAVLFALSPVNSSMVITIWKDILYSCSILALLILLLKIWVSQGEWLDRKPNLILFAFVAFTVINLRHNGIAAGMGTLFFLFIFYPARWKQIAVASALTIFLWFGLKGPVYKLLRIEPSTNLFIANQLLYHIGAHLQADTLLTKEEEKFLNQVLPVDTDWYYNCNYSGTFLYNPELDLSYVFSQQDKLSQVFFTLLEREPVVDLQHELCSTSLIWRIQPYQHSKDYFNTVPIQINNGKIVTIPEGIVTFPEGVVLEVDSIWPKLENYLAEFIFWSGRPARNSLLWRPAGYLYLFLVGIFFLYLRSKDWRVTILAVPVLAHSAFLAISMSSQDFRYQYPVYLACMVFWPFLFFVGRHCGKDDESSDHI